jgi:hypothetical protein
MCWEAVAIGCEVRNKWILLNRELSLRTLLEFLLRKPTETLRTLPEMPNAEVKSRGPEPVSRPKSSSRRVWYSSKSNFGGQNRGPGPWHSQKSGSGTLSGCTVHGFESKTENSGGTSVGNVEKKSISCKLMAVTPKDSRWAYWVCSKRWSRSGFIDS